MTVPEVAGSCELGAGSFLGRAGDMAITSYYGIPVIELVHREQLFSLCAVYYQDTTTVRRRPAKAAATVVLDTNSGPASAPPTEHTEESSTNAIENAVVTFHDPERPPILRVQLGNCGQKLLVSAEAARALPFWKRHPAA